MKSVFPYKENKLHNLLQNSMKCVFSHTIIATFVSLGASMPPTGATSYKQPHTGHSHALCLLPPTQDTNTGVNQPVTALPFTLLITLAGEFQTTEHPPCCLVLNHTPSFSHSVSKDIQGLFKSSYERALNDVCASE